MKYPIKEREYSVLIDLVIISAIVAIFDKLFLVTISSKIGNCLYPAFLYPNFVIFDTVWLLDEPPGDQF